LNTTEAQFSVVPTIPRQTPHLEFGRVLAQSLGQVSGGVSSMAMGHPILSAAVASVRAVLPQVAVPPGTTAALPGPSGGGGLEMIEAQRLMQQDGQRFNVAYLQLQDDIQRESREHSTLSNILKVRHDSAKAAINNIR